MFRSRSQCLRTALSLCCLGLVGCSDASQGAPSDDDPEDRQARREALERKTPPRLPERVPEQRQPAITGEVPDDLMQKVRQHLAQRTGADPASFQVIEGRFVEWPNGAMGCPQPGMNYTQQPVRGYLVVLEHTDRKFDYRVTESGLMMICESAVLDRPPSQ